MWINYLILSLFYLTNLVKADDGIDWYQYYKMPSLHHSDDYKECIYDVRGSYNVYCRIHSIIKPDNTSALWRYIEEFSSDYKRHFAHDLITAGLCMRKCEEQLAELSEKERDDLYVPEFPWRIRYDFDFTSFKNATVFRKTYGRLANQCNNLWLKKNYNLTAYSSVQYCSDNFEAEKIQYDFLHYLFIVILLLIIGVVSCATIVDRQMNDENSLSYYKKTLKNVTRGRRILLCFSLIRNWYKLTAQPKGELGRDMRFLLAVRYATTFIVVLGHILIGLAFLPNISPEYIELSFHRITTLFHNCGTTVVQTFFVVSGLLLYISFNDILKDNQLNTKHFVFAFIYRYVRLTPVYAFVILFNATWMYPLGEGSYWKSFAELEMSYCRRYWWSHLLYVNNYVNPQQQCMIQTWYLAVDTQLFVFSLFLFTFMWKFPRNKNYILGAVFFIACIIQFLVTYINEYDGIYFMLPEFKRNPFYTPYLEFENDYIATHTNAGNFIIGIGLGMFYLYCKRTKLDFGAFKWFVWLWNGIPAIGFIILLFTTWLFINHNFAKPSIWISLLSVFTRNFWGLLAIVFVSGFMSSIKSPIKNLLNWPVFTPLSRLTYCIYLCHITVAMFLFGELNARVDVNNAIVIVYTLALFVVSNILAVLLCLCLEYPLTGLTKELFRSQREKKPEGQDQEVERRNGASELSKL